MAKVAFEKYFLRKVRRGSSEPAYERVIMKALGIAKLRPEPPPASPPNDANGENDDLLFREDACTPIFRMPSSASPRR